MHAVTSDELVAKRLATTPPYVTEKKKKKKKALNYTFESVENYTILMNLT